MHFGLFQVDSICQKVDMIWQKFDSICKKVDSICQKVESICQKLTQSAKNLTRYAKKLTQSAKKFTWPAKSWFPTHQSVQCTYTNPMNITPNDFPLQLISVYWCCSLREAINSEEEKIFFVKSLHKMVTPPSPFYEVPIYFFP